MELTEERILIIADGISTLYELHELGVELQISVNEIDKIRCSHPLDLFKTTCTLLQIFAEKTKHKRDAYLQVKTAMSKMEKSGLFAVMETQHLTDVFPLQYESDEDVWLTENRMLYIAGQLPLETTSIGILLGVPWRRIKRFRTDYSNNYLMHYKLIFKDFTNRFGFGIEAYKRVKLVLEEASHNILADDLDWL